MMLDPWGPANPNGGEDKVTSLFGEWAVGGSPYIGVKSKISRTGCPTLLLMTVLAPSRTPPSPRAQQRSKWEFAKPLAPSVTHGKDSINNSDLHPYVLNINVPGSCLVLLDIFSFFLCFMFFFDLEIIGRQNWMRLLFVMMLEGSSLIVIKPVTLQSWGVMCQPTGKAL